MDDIKRAVRELDEKIDRLVREIQAGNINVDEVANRLDALRRDEVGRVADLAARAVRD